MEPKEILIKAREYLSDKDNWLGGDWIDGEYHAGPMVCALGAVAHVAGYTEIEPFYPGGPGWWQFKKDVFRQWTPGEFWRCNTTTPEGQVVAALDKCAKAMRYMSIEDLNDAGPPNDSEAEDNYDMVLQAFDCAIQSL